MVDVLVVDDNAGVREAACDLLHDEGWRVAGAASAGEALVRLERIAGPVTLVIDLDLGAGMSGIALAEEIMRIRPGCGILLASGGEYPAGACPHDVFLAKPFAAGTLLDAVAVVHRRVTRHSAGLEMACRAARATSRG